MLLTKCKIIEFPKIIDPSGNLTFIENSIHIPFNIKRVFYIYDAPGGANRGGHAHYMLHELIIAVSGSFDVWVDDGFSKSKYTLNRSYSGLYIPPLVWRDINNFNSGSVCLALASELYDENDYLRQYDTFTDAVRERCSDSKVS